MTDEQFRSLAPFEDIFKRVKARKYQGYPGLAALQTMAAYMKTVRPNYRPNLGCSGCAKNLVLEVAGHYFAEKEKRDAAKV